MESKAPNRASVSEEGSKARTFYSKGGSGTSFSDEFVTDSQQHTTDCDNIQPEFTERQNNHTRSLEARSDETDPSFSSSFFLTSDQVQQVLISNKSLRSGDTHYQPLALQDNPHEVLKIQLKTTCRCEESHCDDIACQQIKVLLNEIQSSWLPNRSKLGSVHKTLMLVMFNHWKECIHPHCPHYWCTFQETIDAKQNSECAAMQSKLKNFVSGFTLPLFKSMKRCVMFDIKLPAFPLAYTMAQGKNGIDDDVFPLVSEDELWSRICMLGNSHKMMLVKPHQQYSMKSDQFWLVKKVSEFGTWDVYEHLKAVREIQDVTPLMWAASFDKHILICYSLEGLSLHEYLHSMYPLKSNLIITIMSQLMSVLSHLHGENIVFLNWSSKNILISQSNTNNVIVKLCNFDSSAIVGKTEDPSLKLPIHLCPPELLKPLPTIENVATDMWGVACLLYEIVTRKSVWYEQRHFTVEELTSLMNNQIHPEVPITSLNFKPIFDACWKIEPEERTKVSGLQDLLAQCLRPKS